MCNSLQWTGVYHDDVFLPSYTRLSALEQQLLECLAATERAIRAAMEDGEIDRMGGPH
jgi:hypothetical protein